MLSTGNCKDGTGRGKERGSSDLFSMYSPLCFEHKKNIFFDNLKGSYCFVGGQHIYVCIPIYFPFPSFGNPEKSELRVTGKNLAKSEAKSL